MFLGGLCQSANHVNPVAGQLAFSCPADIEQFRGTQRPNFFSEIVLSDFYHCIWLFHIRTQFRKHLDKEDIDADSDHQLFFVVFWIAWVISVALPYMEEPVPSSQHSSIPKGSTWSVYR